MVRKEIAGSGETRLETWVSYVLISGVLASLLVEAAGIILFYLISHSADISQNKSVFVQGRDFFTFLGTLFHQALTGVTPIRLMALGVALLILTPYARAVMSVIYFCSTRNIKYLVITAFVLAVLTASLIIH